MSTKSPNIEAPWDSRDHNIVDGAPLETTCEFDVVDGAPLEPPCELDVVDGVKFAPLPSSTNDDNTFERKEPRLPTLHLTNNSKENEFEKGDDVKLPKLRIIRILGGMFLSFSILALLAAPLGTHWVAKEGKRSYLYYEIPPKEDNIKETHIIQVTSFFSDII